jgi:hypothetical protein
VLYIKTNDNTELGNIEARSGLANHEFKGMVLRHKLGEYSK